MKINDSSGKCATKKIKAHVELCTDRRVSITCQQLNKRKSKLLTEKETWHPLGDDTEKVILVRPDVSLRSGICYATGHHCCTVHNTEEVVLGKCVNTQQRTCAMAAIHSIRKSYQKTSVFLSAVKKKTFYKTSRTCVLKTFIILFNSLFVFFVGHCLLTYSGRLHPEAKIKTFP